MTQDYIDFTIVHRRCDGQPDFVYPSDGNLASCVITSIQVCRRMLRDTKIRSAFVSLAREFDRSGPEPWYHNQYSNTGEAVNYYIDTVLAVFPIVYVDDSITTLSCLGGHPRRPWSIYFDPCDQSILLNGMRIRDMVKAFDEAAQTNDPLDINKQHFQTFVFMFAHVVLHELGHMLVTFLTRGEAMTPPRIRAEVGGYSDEYNGEAGRNLELILFGGTLEYYLGDADVASQPGTPYILTKDGIRRISQRSIDDTVNLYIHSPYHLEGPYIHPLSMRRLGTYDIPAILTDPRDWLVADELQRCGYIVHIGPDSALARLPLYPSLRA